MAYVTVSKEFNVDADKLWQQVRGFDDMDKYLPQMITSCSLEGSGQGAKRVCGTENGDILETLTLLDDDNKTLEYSIDNEDAPLPLTNYTGKASVKSVGENKTQFTWSAEFEPKGMPENEVVQIFEGAFSGMLQNMVDSVR